MLYERLVINKSINQSLCLPATDPVPGVGRQEELPGELGVEGGGSAGVLRNRGAGHTGTRAGGLRKEQYPQRYGL